MTNKRRKFTPEQKASLVLEILKEEKSVSQLATEHGIHTNVLNRWKAEAVQNLSELFVDDRKGITKMKIDDTTINRIDTDFSTALSLGVLDKKV
jgi:putative transposase